MTIGFFLILLASSFTSPLIAFSQTTTPSNTVLFLGDSHSPGTFTNHLTKLFQEKSPKTRFVAHVRCGFWEGDFLKGGRGCGDHYVDTSLRKNQQAKSWEDYSLPVSAPLNMLLKSLNPKVVMVSLGANDIPSILEQWHGAKGNDPRMHSGLHQAIVNVMTLILKRGSKCLWIGPPDTKYYGQLDKLGNSWLPACQELSTELGITPRKLISRSWDSYYAALQAANATVQTTLKKSCTILDSRHGNLPFLDFDKIESALTPTQKEQSDGGHFETLGEPGKSALKKWAEKSFKTFEELK